MNASATSCSSGDGCTSEETGRQLAGECPRLFEPGHGSWYYAVQVTTVGGRKARYRRGGFATREAAVTPGMRSWTARPIRPLRERGRWRAGCCTG